MIDASMLLHMISALDTLEKILPVEESGEYAVKKWNGKLSKEPDGPNTGPGRGGWEWAYKTTAVLLLTKELKDSKGLF